MISIVIPLFNKEKQIVKTLKTVLNQSFQDFEIIIVNDGSTDHSVSEVEKVHDERIHLFHQMNAGVSAARNKAIEQAKGEFVAFLDADDEWDIDYLKVQYDLTQRFSTCDVFATNYVFKKGKSLLVPTSIKRIPFKEKSGILSNYFEVASYSHPPLWTSAVMVRRQAILSVGSFPIGIKSGEDLLTWARLACKYSIAYTKKAMAIFNEGDEHNLINKPTRPHDENDYVADELIKLQESINLAEKKNLKKYISLWYKMKVSVFVRLGNIRDTWKYGFNSLHYNLCNYKVLLMMILVLFPHRIQNFIISKY